MKEILWEEENLIELEKSCLNNNVNEQKDIINVISPNLTTKAWKDIGIKSGIYKIVNVNTEKYYVGSAFDIRKRWYKHRFHLNRNDHQNDYLQNAWNKDGINSFKFMLVENVLNTITKEKMLKIEQRYLDIAKTEQDKCYNLNFEASGGEIRKYSRTKLVESQKHSYATTDRAEKIRNAQKRYWNSISEDVKNERSNQLRLLNVNRTSDSIEKMRKSLIGKKASEETKRKMRESHRRRFELCKANG